MATPLRRVLRLSLATSVAYVVLVLVLVLGAASAFAGTFTFATEPGSPLPPAAAWYRGCIQNATPAQLMIVVALIGEEPSSETSNPDGTRNACWNDLLNDGQGSRFNRWVQAVGVDANLELAVVVDVRMGWNPFAYYSDSGIEFAPSVANIPAGWTFSVDMEFAGWGNGFSYTYYNESTTCPGGTCSLPAGAFGGPGHASADVTLRLPSGHAIWDTYRFTSYRQYASAPEHTGC